MIRLNLPFLHAQCPHTALDPTLPRHRCLRFRSVVLFLVLDSRRFEGACGIHLQPLKIKSIRSFETSEICDPVTPCNTPENISYNRDAFCLHLQLRHYFSVSRSCQRCIYSRTITFTFPLSMQYRRFVFILSPVSGSSRTTVVTKRITRRQCKQRRVREQEREREDEDILNGKLNDF